MCVQCSEFNSGYRTVLYKNYLFIIIITINTDDEERDMKILNGKGSLKPLL